jgi:hypothetical protein
MLTVPDSLAPNKFYCNMEKWTPIHNIFRVSLKQCMLGKACYIPHLAWKSGYSFTDFADMHLVVRELNGNATEVLQMLSEHTDK